MFPFFFGGKRTIYLTVSSSQADYDLFVEAGSPVDPVSVVITVEAATVLYGSTTGLEGFKTGTAWAAQTELKLINNGNILGMGGDGGDGASQIYSGQGDCGSTTPGTDGGNGGDAITLAWDITIDNTNGNIWGGGGGGGGFNSGSIANEVCVAGPGSGGGAGGYLTTVSSGGIGGTASGATGENYSGCDGEDGSGGASGVGGRKGSTTQFGCPAFVSSPVGGAYGTAGDSPVFFVCDNAGLGGAAGKAVELGGNTITWLGGSSSPNVEGAVS